MKMVFKLDTIKISILLLIFLILTSLKLAGKIDWPWLAITTPIWVPLLLLIGNITLIILKAEIEHWRKQ